MRLIDAVPIGRESARSAAELQAIIGARSARVVTREIEGLRRRGVPICATTGERPGYFIASDLLELETYLAALDRRLASVRRTRACLGDTYTLLAGQARWSFFEDGDGVD